MMQFRSGGFQALPVIIKNLLIINGLVFLAQLVFDHLNGSGNLEPGTGFMSHTFALHHILSPLFKPWQVFTYMFMHGSVMHILGNMFALWIWGSRLEVLWGPKRFLIVYLLCGLGGAVLHLGSLYYESLPLLHDFANFKAMPNYQNFITYYNNGLLPRGLASPIPIFYRPGRPTLPTPNLQGAFYPPPPMV